MIVNVGPMGGEAGAASHQIYCKSCASPLVQVSDWSREDAKNWRVRIWCPECGSELHAILNHSEVAYLSSAIEGGFAHLLETLAELQDLTEADLASVDPVTLLRSERMESQGF